MHARSFDQDVSHFDISSLHSVHEMFNYARNFSQAHAASFVCKLYGSDQINDHDIDSVFLGVPGLVVPRSGNDSWWRDESMCSIMSHPDCRRSVVDEVFRARAAPRLF